MVSKAVENPNPGQRAGLGLWASGGTILSAVLASACCWLPLTLVAFGVSGAAVSSAFEPWRPLFAVATFGFLGLAFFLSYRPVRLPGSSCEVDEENEECCSASESGPTRLQRINRGLLWLVTPLALAFVLFPNYAGALLGGTGSVSESVEEGRVIGAEIDGMTCAGCASGLRSALLEVDWIVDAEVDFESGRARIVTTDSGEEGLDEAIRDAIEQAGYTPREIHPEEP